MNAHFAQPLWYVDKRRWPEEARLFWSSEKGKNATSSLLSLLSGAPVLLSELGSFSKNEGVPPQKAPGKLKVFLDNNPHVEVRKDGRKRAWCGATGKDDRYWSCLQDSGDAREFRTKISVAPIVDNPSIEESEHTHAQFPVPNGTHFWGTLRKQADKWGGDEVSVSNVQIEKIGGEQEDILFPKLTIQRNYISDEMYNFIIGYFDKQTPFPEREQRRSFMLRTWNDFKEGLSGEYPTFIDFLKHCSESGMTSELTPIFETRYPDIIIFDQRRLYQGFVWSDNRLKVDGVRMSKDSFEGVPSLASASLFVYNNGDDIHFLSDSFLLVSPFVGQRWRSSDDFVGDASFWRQWNSEEQSSDDDMSGGDTSGGDMSGVDAQGGDTSGVDAQGGDTSGDDMQSVDSSGGDTQGGSTSGRDSHSRQQLGNHDPDEKEAIISFWESLRDFGWQYSLRDIIRFHTSVRCEPLTILGGMPGSGKSALAKMYASYFGIENNSFLRIDVQPSWHDRMDFLGFVKTHDKQLEFVEAETGMASFLSRAKNSPNGLWLACLEEINLARPEHYFADFLQRMSLPDSERQDSPILFYLGEDKSKAVPIVSAVRFVGTCNFDETTQNFSPRFLDRCNYIELQPPSLESAFFPENGSAPQQVAFDEPTRSKWEWSPWTSVERNRTDDNRDIVMQIINGSKICLQDLGILPSPRIVSSIVRYIEARIDADEEERQDGQVQAGRFANDVFVRAFDEAVAQRILPKLSSAQGAYPAVGIEKKLEELKSHLRLDTQVQSLSIDVIDRYINSFSTKMNP